jgi:hypothetical protein
MAPFDALYGRRCRTPLNWSETGERTLFGSDLVKNAEEKVQVKREFKDGSDEAKELP